MEPSLWYPTVAGQCKGHKSRCPEHCNSSSKRGVRSREWGLRHSGFLTKAEGNFPDPLLRDLGFSGGVAGPWAFTSENCSTDQYLNLSKTRDSLIPPYPSPTPFPHAPSPQPSHRCWNQSTIPSHWSGSGARGFLLEAFCSLHRMWLLTHPGGHLEQSEPA